MQASISIRFDATISHQSSPVDNSSAVQEVQRETDLGRIETRMMLLELAHPLKVVHEVTAASDLNDEIESLATLE